MSKLCCSSVLEAIYILAYSADPDEMPHPVASRGISSGSTLFANAPVFKADNGNIIVVYVTMAAMVGHAAVYVLDKHIFVKTLGIGRQTDRQNATEIRQTLLRQCSTNATEHDHSNNKCATVLKQSIKEAIFNYILRDLK